MRKEKQKLAIKIDNFDIKKTENGPRHSELLPNTIRAIICGPSNSGKTNVMLSLLTDPNGLRFKNVYVYSKSLYQDKYKFLQDVLNKVPAVNFYGYSDSETIVAPEEAEADSIFIFDDVACEKQDMIRNYFCMGRHNKIDCFYLNQTYSKIPKELVRDNANVLILFKQDDMNLKHIYEDHVNTDMTFDIFKNICTDCWTDKYGFLVIVKDNEIHKGRYRNKFDTFLLI